MIDYKTIRKIIKQNPSTSYYPDPDNFDNYEDYQEVYEDEKRSYMQFIATQLNYNSYEDMFADLSDKIEPEEAEADLFDFFYNNMVNEDYYDYYSSSDDEYDDYDDDYADDSYDY